MKGDLEYLRGESELKQLDPNEEGPWKLYPLELALLFERDEVIKLLTLQGAKLDDVRFSRLPSYICMKYASKLRLGKLDIGDEIVLTSLKAEIIEYVKELYIGKLEGQPYQQINALILELANIFGKSASKRMKRIKVRIHKEIATDDTLALLRSYFREVQVM